MTLEVLEAQIEAATDIGQKIDLMNTLAWELRYNDPQRGLHLCEAAYRLSQGDGANIPVHQQGMVKSLCNIGFFHTRMGNFDQALTHLFEALPIGEALGDERTLMGIFHNTGVAYRQLGDYPEALNCHFKALDIAKKFEDRENEAFILNTMGLIYVYTKEFETASLTYERSLQLYQEVGDHNGEGWVYNNIAMLYLRTEDFEDALSCALQSLQIVEEVENRMFEVYVLDTVGHAYLNKQDYEQALTYLHRSLEHARIMGVRRTEPETLLNIANVHLAQHHDEQALEYLYQALHLAEELNSKSDIFECHRHLALIYKQMGKFEQALTHHERFHAIKEEVFNEQEDTKLKTLEVIHRTETAKKEAEIYHLKNVALEQEMTERKRVEAELQEKNQQLQELNAAKDKFFSIVSHDLRGPFGTLLGFVQVLDDRFEEFDRQHCQSISQKIRRSAEKVFALLENLLTWARIQQGGIHYEPEVIVLKDLIEENLSIFIPKAEQKGIVLKYDIPEHLAVMADGYMLNTICRNLLANALKFTETGGTVTVSARPHHEAAIAITIADTGRGISAEGLAKLFRIDVQYTKRGTAGERGTGLGLILCKELVEKNNGRIWVTSEVGKGATFVLTIPAASTLPEP